MLPSKNYFAPMGLTVMWAFVFIAPVLAQETGQVAPQTAPSIVELLHQEVLDTVSAGRAVHLTTPESTAVVAPTELWPMCLHN